MPADQLNISGSASETITSVPQSNDAVVFVDNSDYFLVFKESKSDEAVLSDESLFINSDFIKKTEPDTAIFDGYGIPFLTIRNDVGDESQFSSEAHELITIRNAITDTAILNDSAHEVIHSTNTISNTIELSDTTGALVSHQVSKSFSNATINDLGTTETVLYTCSSVGATLMNISLCNIVSADIVVSVIIYRSGTPYYIAKDITITQKEVNVINNNDNMAIQIENGDDIRVISDTAASCDVYAALFEII